MKTLVVICAVTAAGLLVIEQGSSQNPPREQVGPLKGGGFLLNSGWTIRPAGVQVPVDTLPIATAISRNGKFALVMNAGYNPASISVIDIAKKGEVGRTRLPDCWLGLTIATRGNTVYAGGGSSGMVYELSLDAETGALSRTRQLAAVPDINKKGVAFIGDVALSPDEHILYAADLYDNMIAVINLQSGQLLGQWKVCRRPYRVIVPPGGAQLIVSSWGDGAIYQYDTRNGNQIGKTRIGPHTTDMLWVNQPPPADQGTSSYAARLFVAAANTNNVYSLGVTRDGQLSMLESINVSTTPMHPLGMTPSALGIDPSNTQLYVVCADANAVAVANIAGPHAVVAGFIPTGWYPTAVRVLSDGQLVILSGKGLGSRPNPDGPNPGMRARATTGGGKVADGYVAHIQTGTAAFVPAITENRLADYTDTVLANSPYSDEMLDPKTQGEQDAFFSHTTAHASPIQHVIYIIKENRTYDQVLGDMDKGNGDKSLVLFGEQVTPNQHQLARDFVLYDNFYENGDVSAEGHNWASAAIAPDYTVKTWPNTYGDRNKEPYGYQGGEPANTPPAGYIWDNAIQAGITVRDYGEWAENLPLNPASGARQIDRTNDPVLDSNIDMNYRSFDVQYPDIERAREFIREWKNFETQGQPPQLSILWLGNDHTEGLKAGALTPFAHVADNDYAVGMIVDAVSHSHFWNSTALFIMEDDAQNGPDHVDSHRAPVWVVSPFTRRGAVDSTMYNQAGLLRTIELIVGLRPLTHFDAGGRPMFAGFSREPDTRPYTVISPKVSLTERNPAKGAGATASARMDFSDADKVDDAALNAVLWRAIKHTDPPPPVRSAFGKP